MEKLICLIGFCEVAEAEVPPPPMATIPRERKKLVKVN